MQENWNPVEMVAWFSSQSIGEKVVFLYLLSTSQDKNSCFEGFFVCAALETMATEHRLNLERLSEEPSGLSSKLACLSH